MSILAEYRYTLHYLSKREIIQERLELFKDINGNAFFPVKWWPSDMQLTFWKKPIGDRDTFKLVLFLLGNGCSPYLLKRWILLSQFWAEHPTAEKRARQIDFILNNADSKAAIWFYYDLDYHKHLYLNGLPRDDTKKGQRRKSPANRKQ